MRGLNFLALPDDRKVRLQIGEHGRATFIRHNMLVLPQSATDAIHRNAATLWYPHPLSDAASEPDWIVNNCTDPDTFAGALQWLEETFPAHIPVFNSARAVAAATRDNQAARFGAIPGLTVPQAHRFRFETEDDLRRVFEDNAFTFPVLVRPVEFQAGVGMQRIDSHDDWASLLYSRWYRKDHVMIQFIDTKTADDVYLKVRVTFIGGKPYIRHCKAASHWLVQGQQNDVIVARPEYELELIDALEAHEGFMGICRQIGEISDLDFFGADMGFDLASDRFVLFEANPSMSMFFPERVGREELYFIRRKRLQIPAEEHLNDYIGKPAEWRNMRSGQSAAGSAV